jgi:high-affinity iron transporter
MMGSAIIVFREVLEAALIIAVVLGATQGIRSRGYWVLCGIGSGAGAGVGWPLSQQSWLGMALHMLAGYNDGPAGMQLLFYAATLVSILALMYWVRPAASTGTARAAQTTATQ